MNRRAVLLALVVLASCAEVSRESTRPIRPDTILPKVNVVSWNVIVPRSLKTSESNAYYPMVDIIWHGDPPGDRYQQVAQIFRNALTWGMAPFDRGRKVNIQIEVKKFHALTPRARYTTGGVHTMRFYMTITDATTGAVIMPREKIDADLRALGGAAAVRAEDAGQGQKVRITQHLAGTFQRILLSRGLGTLKPATADGG